MPYGTVKVDNITFDQGGSDQNVTASGIYRAITSGVTVTGTISGAVLVGTTTVSGATVTGTTVQGTTVQGVSGTFTSLTGTTTTGTTANFVSGVFTTHVSGATITGTTAQFTSGTFVSLTGTTITGTTISGTTVSSTTGTFTSLTGTTITGTTVNSITGTFTSLTGVTVTGTTANFASGVFTTQVSGLTVTGTQSSFTSGNFVTLSGATATFTSGVIASGTAAAPSLSILGDPNTGLFSPGADQVAVSTGGTGRLTVSTTAVSSTLAVDHPLGAVGTPSITFTGDLNTGFWSPSADALAASTAGSERLRITSTGNVGIGTTSPGAIFHTVATSVAAATVGAFLQNSDNTAGTEVRLALGPATSNLSDNRYAWLGCVNTGGTNGTALTFATGPGGQAATERMRITSTGNVGIGSTAPQQLLHVQSSGGSGGQIQIGNASTGAASSDGLLIGYDGSNDVIFNNQEATDIKFSANGSERMRIRSDGSVCLGKGISLGDGNRNVTTSIYISGTVIASGAGNSTLKYSTSSGLVTYDTSSRLVKENIQDCPYGAAEIKLLKPRKYFRTDDQREEIGFVADELVEVLPEFVPIGPKSVITKNDQDTEEIPLGVNYEKLTAVLTAALQEALQQIENLEARLTAAGI